MMLKVTSHPFSHFFFINICFLLHLYSVYYFGTSSGGQNIFWRNLIFYQIHFTISFFNFLMIESLLYYTGKELPGVHGYKYYGAAKDLPGVRELFQEKDDEAELNRRKRFDCYVMHFVN